MSSELTLMVLRLGFLLLLWLFVFSVLFALRSDLFGAPVRKLKSGDQGGGSAPPPGPVITAPAQPAPAPTPVGAGQAQLPPPSVDAASGPVKQLVILTGVAEGTSIPLDEGVVTVGRSPDSTLVIVDEYTSTYHAKLQRSGDMWTITDLDSTNGTKVNGTRITAPTPLPAYTRVTIGTTTFELRP